MSPAALKQQFHDLIDQTEDADALEMWYDLVHLNLLQQNARLSDRLSPEQKITLQGSYEESFSEENLLPESFMAERLKKWF